MARKLEKRHLTTKEITMFKDILLKEKQQATESITALSAKRAEIEAGSVPDEADLAKQDLDMGMELRLGNRTALYLKKIEAALDRIEKGAYGICLGTGEPIEFKRLLARPTAEYSIAYKEEQELREGRSADGRKHKSIGRSMQT